MTVAPPATIVADYFDGVRAQAHEVALRIEGGQLHVDGAMVQRSIAVRDVQWPERTRHGARIAQLPDGASLHGRVSAEWDRWLAGSGATESWVVRAQQSWRWTAGAAAALIVVCVGGYLWGLPLAAQGVLAVTPRAVDAQVGRIAMASMEDSLFKPSKLPKAEQDRLQALFRAAHERRRATTAGPSPQDDAPPHRVIFRASRIGPNALALPDGSIVFTDELVTLLRGHDATLIGIYGHELGHVQHRHGMRLLIQVGALGAVTSVALGDFSSVLAGAPALLGHLAYSRDFERQADDEAITLLRANGIRPSVMVKLFEQLQAERRHRAPQEGASAGSAPEPADVDHDEDAQAGGDADPGISFSSHPADAERIRRFQDADGVLPPSR